MKIVFANIFIPHEARIGNCVLGGGFPPLRSSRTNEKFLDR